MKIALVILHADVSRGGAERYTLDLAQGLSRRGHSVSLLASSFAGEPASANDNVHLPATGATRLGRYLRFLKALDDHLGRTPYDIVHAMLPVRSCNIYHPHAGIAAAAVQRGHMKYCGAVAKTAAKFANRINLKRRKFAAVERQLLQASHPPIVLCLSEYVKRDVTNHYALAPDRLATLFNAIDLAKFDPAARPQAGAELRARFAIGSDRVVALMIAQDFARKGLRQAIVALSEIREPRLTLLVVGKENSDSYARLAKQRGVGNQVIFAGHTDDPYSFYRAADFFVLPTRHDPCSLVVLEALAMGLPVISTAQNGACEIMTDGQHGYVLPDPSDVAALGESMCRLMDAAVRRQMSESCLALRPALAYHRHLDQLIQIYQSAVEQRSAKQLPRL